MRFVVALLLLVSAVMAEQIFAVRGPRFSFFDVSGSGVASDAWRARQVELQDGQDANAVAAAHGFHNLGQIGSLANMYRFAPLNAGPHATRSASSRSIALRGDPTVIMVEEQVKKQQEKRGRARDSAEM
jgi:hypothetical protein